MTLKVKTIKGYENLVELLGEELGNSIYEAVNALEELKSYSIALRKESLLLKEKVQQSVEQMIENIKAWNYLKTKYTLQQIFETEVSRVGKNAKQIVKDTVEAIQPTQQEQ